VMKRKSAVQIWTKEEVIINFHLLIKKMTKNLNKRLS